MQKKILQKLSVIGVVLIIASAASAQHSGEESADVYTPAIPLERVAPVYPAAALRKNQEGWVLVNFVISRTGDVIDPVIESSNGLVAFETAALEAVRGWRYAPATRNGEPVENSVSRSRIVFSLNRQPRPKHRFVSDINKAAKHIDADELEAAAQIIEELERNGRASLQEDAYFWWIKSVYLERTQASAAERIAALSRAVFWAEDPDSEYLPPDLFVESMRYLFALRVEARQFKAAARELERLRNSKGSKQATSYAPTLAALEEVNARIAAVIYGSSLIIVDGRLGDDGHWAHEPMRREFSITDLEGRIDAIDIRCEKGTERHDFLRSNGVWQIPQSWGNCTAYVKGAPGTLFVFQEHPLPESDRMSVN